MRAEDIPRNYNAVEILENNLKDRSNKPALYTEERVLTFGEVCTEVNQVCNALKTLDVRKGDAVAILSPDCAEWVISFFATWKIGAVALGISTLLTFEEYSYILNDSCARVLIIHHSLVEIYRNIVDSCSEIQHVIIIGGVEPIGNSLPYHRWIEGEQITFATITTHRDDFCTLNYSSGTTGEPKGILHAHKDFPISSKLYAVDLLGMTEDDLTFSIAKLYFTYGLGSNLVYPWYVGAGTILTTKPARVATNTLEVIDRFKPTIYFSVPTAYAFTLAVEEFPADYDLSSLRMCVSAGEALPAPVWYAWRDHAGLKIVEGFGTTENFCIFLSNSPQEMRPGSCGKAVKGFELKIIDDDGREVPQGEIGELIVKGETAAQFYLHQYCKSQMVFQGEWLYTGDKLFVDEEGYYWHAGRMDDMLKVGGIWVSPVEVESTLTGHPAVLECAVVSYPDHDNLHKPKAFVILNRKFLPSAELAGELIEYCREEMAAYKRPRWIEFVDDLPRTSTGKIQRARLRKEAV